MSQTSDINYATKDKLVNLIRLLWKLQKASTLVKMLEKAYDPTIATALKFIDLLHNLVIPHLKLVIEPVGVSGLEHL